MDRPLRRVTTVRSDGTGGPLRIPNTRARAVPQGSADSRRRVRVELGGRRLKFIESGTFRALRSPADVDGDALMLGSVVEIAEVAWKIVGSATNPHRRDETLLFVEIITDRRGTTSHDHDRARRASDRR
jgi:hypothetical protein